MLGGHQESYWQQTSHLMALIANTNRDSKKHPRSFMPEDFNPYKTKTNVIEIDKDNIGLLEQAFKRKVR